MTRVIFALMYAGCAPTLLAQPTATDSGIADTDDDDHPGGGGGGRDPSTSTDEAPAPSGPDLGDVGFSVTYEIVQGMYDRFSSHVDYVVEICFDSADGGGVSAQNLGDQRVDGYFEVAMGLVRVSDAEVAVADDVLWSDIVIRECEGVYWNGPFCTTVATSESTSEPVDYALFVGVDVWDTVDESDEDDNYAFSDPIPLAPIDSSNM